MRLVSYYGISITDLIPDPDPTQTAVVRKNARRRLESSSEHAALELLTHDTNRKLFPVLASLDPGGTIDTAKPSPGRELFLLIPRGTIEIDDDVTPDPARERGRKPHRTAFSTRRALTFDDGPQPFYTSHILREPEWLHLRDLILIGYLVAAARFSRQVDKRQE